MKQIHKFKGFLDDIKEKNPVLIESIKKAFNLIFEEVEVRSTEKKVEEVKKKVGSGSVQQEWEKLLAGEETESSDIDIEEWEKILASTPEPEDVGELEELDFESLVPEKPKVEQK